MSRGGSTEAVPTTLTTMMTIEFRSNCFSRHVEKFPSRWFQACSVLSNHNHVKFWISFFLHRLEQQFSHIPLLHLHEKKSFTFSKRVEEMTWNDWLFPFFLRAAFVFTGRNGCLVFFFFTAHHFTSYERLPLYYSIHEDLALSYFGFWTTWLLLSLIFKLHQVAGFSLPIALIHNTR